MYTLTANGDAKGARKSSTAYLNGIVKGMESVMDNNDMKDKPLDDVVALCEIRNLLIKLSQLNSLELTILNICDSALSKHPLTNISVFDRLNKLSNGTPIYGETHHPQ